MDGSKKISDPVSNGDTFVSVPEIKKPVVKQEGKYSKI